jgi:type I restriction enzyme S subunit
VEEAKGERMTWEKIRLSELLTSPIQNGYSPICPERPNGKWILGLGALKGSGFDSTQIKPAPINDSKVNDFLLQPGDFLVSRSNTLDKVGRAALFTGQVNNCAYPDLMMRFRIDESRLYQGFLEMFLRSSEAVRHFQRCASGTSETMVKINKGVLEKLPVPLPPYKEQVAIAELLAIWNCAIEKTERLIAAKDRYLCALYQKCFQAGTSMNASWKSRKLATYLVARNEKAIPSGDVPLYSLTIENGVTAKTDRYNRDFLVKDMDSKTYKVVYPGDVVFNPANLRWGAIARSVVEHKVVISPIYEVLEIKKDIVDPELLTHAITCPRQIGIYATKTEGTLIERMAVKLDAFLFTEILLPETLEEQRKIAALLCTARKEIDLLKKQLEAYRQQKLGLMQKLLTGQWRVKINKGETN